MRFHVLLAASVAAAFGDLAAEVETWQTVGDGEMAQLRDGPVCAAEEAWQTACVDLDAAKPSHPYTGMGGSLGEASCRVLARLDAARRREVLNMLFTRAGANLSMLRLHVGSSDYSASIYSYDEVPGDVEMKHFSIDHDRKEVIPMVREALAVLASSDTQSVIPGSTGNLTPASPETVVHTEQLSRAEKRALRRAERQARREARRAARQARRAARAAARLAKKLPKYETTDQE